MDTDKTEVLVEEEISVSGSGGAIETTNDTSINLNFYSVVIDWGDGITEPADIENERWGESHSYDSEGEYRIVSRLYMDGQLIESVEPEDEIVTVLPPERAPTNLQLRNIEEATPNSRVEIEGSLTNRDNDFGIEGADILLNEIESRENLGTATTTGNGEFSTEVFLTEIGDSDWHIVASYQGDENYIESNSEMFIPSTEPTREEPTREEQPISSLLILVVIILLIILICIAIWYKRHRNRAKRNNVTEDTSYKNNHSRVEITSGTDRQPPLHVIPEDVTRFVKIPSKNIRIEIITGITGDETT